MNNNSSLHGLTIFRFIAAFYVFVFHCHLRFPFGGPVWLTDFIGNGAIGMTFFFVLSGFVMAWSSRCGLRKDYIKARIVRIYPAYLFMGLITLPFIFQYDLKTISTSLLLFFSSMQSWVPQSFSIWNFGGSWSVSTELFFYFSFPLLFPIILSNPLKSLLISILISSLIIPIMLIFNEYNLFPSYYINPMYRLPEFVSGASLGVLLIKGRPTSIKFKKTLTLISILALILISPRNNIAFIKNNIVTLPATLFLIYILTVSKIKINLLTIPLIYLGKISYSFYLMQLPIFMLMDKYHPYLSNYNKFYIFIFAIIINSILASISYHFVEEKFKVARKT
ncbi:acyltransferase family protein [Morganella morganii]|uniref:acyltransferase family protein n=1 Tax=Morganella morganii TaxID=582 RepID=UPI002368664A|nr:acyltransferase [Morganella morganii]